MTALTTPTQIDLFRATVMVSAMRLYLNTGMRVNRLYTPAAMREVATEYTGVTYPRSRKGLEQAHADLKALVDKVKECLKQD